MALRLARFCRQLRSNEASKLLASQIRGFAKAPEEDDIVKQTFVDEQKKFRGFLRELTKVPIPLDPKDTAAVKQYADSLKNIRVSLGIPSPTEKLLELIKAAADDSGTVREFLAKTRGIREEFEITDEEGIDSGLASALDAVEKDIGKPLKFDDAAGISKWIKATEGLAVKLNAFKKNLPALENTVNLGIAKADVEEFEKVAKETIKTYQRRDGLESVTVDLKEVDPRPYL